MSAKLTDVSRPSVLVAGTVVVAFVLAFSRWGTNIGVFPLFVSDVLIALALAHAGATRSLKAPVARDFTFLGITPLFALFVSFVAIRVLVSLGQGTILDWLRDAVPFLYSLLALLSSWSLARSTQSTRDATYRVIFWALVIHLSWMSAVALTGNSSGFAFLGAFSSAPVFQIRPDIDVAIVAVTVGLFLRNVLLGNNRVWSISGILLGTIVVFTQTTTRAGQISLLLAVLAAVALSYSASRNAKHRQLLIGLTVPAIIAGLLVVLPMTTAGERLLVTIFPSSVAVTSEESSARGTQRARELTWTTVIDWANEDPARAILGSGFGNDFLEQSGTKQFLEGTTYTGVRSPHNWFVGIYARLGIVGFLLSIAWTFQILWVAWRNRPHFGSDNLLAFSTLVIVTILPVATFGVVLEAPFGAIPFFWAAGVIMARRDLWREKVCVLTEQRSVPGRPSGSRRSRKFHRPVQ